LAGIYATYVEWARRWPLAVVSCDTDSALSALGRYYATFDDGRPRFTGARFETMTALNEDPDTLGPSDFVAVSMLSVNVSPDAAVRLLGPDKDLITELLKQIRPDLDIVDADPELLGPDSAAGRLWDVLRHGKDGLGKTTTSKLMAAKRPRLIPIWDSFVEKATGLDTPDYWRRFQHVLAVDDRRIWKWLGQLRSSAPNVPPAVSELRILDVLLWMSVESQRVTTG
jgi:Family of unknown function (DUF6308)